MEEKKISFTSGKIEICGYTYFPENYLHNLYPALVLCHGIPRGEKNVGVRFIEPDNGGYPELAKKFCLEGYLVMIFNFRGTGESGGNFDILGWREDLKNAINYLFENLSFEKNKLFVLGFSGGAAVAVDVASREKRVSGLIICACPSSFDRIFNKDFAHLFIAGAKNMGIIRDKDFPPSLDEWLEGFKVIRPINDIDKISPRPLLIIHGTQDEIIPLEEAKSLFAKAEEPKKIYLIKNAGHKLRTDERAVDSALTWLKEQISFKL